MLFVQSAGNDADATESATEPSTPRPYSVREAVTLLNRSLKEIDGGREISILGEVGSPRLADHWYFTLKDATDAQISCSFFAQRRRLDPECATPTLGQMVVATGRLEYWDRGGRLSLIVSRLRAEGEGDLHQRFERLKSTLADAGYFDPAARLPMPEFPRRLLMITSRDGAARQDVEATARQRWPGFEVLLHHVPVQGAAATPRIARAIHAARDQAAALGVDAIVLTRGGGSIEDLWCFNEREVADAIHHSRRRAIERHGRGGPPPVPLIAAIGHETDTSIAELAADARASTPTQAAMRLVPDAREHRGVLDSRLERLRMLVAGRLERAAARLAASARHELIRRPERLVDPHLRRAKELQARLDVALRARLLVATTRTDRSESRLAACSPRNRATMAMDRIESDGRRLDRAMTTLLERHRTLVEHAARRLRAVGPEQVLDRGYSLTLDPQGRPIRDASRLTAGMNVTTRLARGEFDATVDRVREDSDSDPRP
jgi:exodeoxyribonuclease VII large subunit